MEFHSPTQLQISEDEIMGSHNYNFVSKFHKNGGFFSPNWKKNFAAKKVLAG